MSTLSTITISACLQTNTDPAQLIRQWFRLYHYGHLSAPPMAIATAAMYAYTALGNRADGRRWELLAAAGAATFSMMPFTLGIMMPTNYALFRLEKKAESGEGLKMERVRPLVVRWGWMHLVRSLFPLAGVLIGISAIL